MDFENNKVQIKLLLEQPLFKAATVVADRLGCQAFIIGGFVRDIILNRPSQDIDIVVVGSGILYAEELAAELNIRGDVKVYKNFGTAHFRYHDSVVELVGARKESYRSNSRNPIVENGTIADDQNRRDFTINALAVRLNNPERGEWVDPFKGLDDLKRMIIRTPLEPDITFSDDPLRMMRAIRFAAQLGFDILPETFLSIKRNCKRI